MIKIIVIIAFITSVFFLARSFYFLIKKNGKANSEHKVVNNLLMRVSISFVLIASVVAMLVTGIIKPNNMQQYQISKSATVNK